MPLIIDTPIDPPPSLADPSPRTAREAVAWYDEVGGRLPGRQLTAIMAEQRPDLWADASEAKAAMVAHLDAQPPREGGMGADEENSMWAHFWYLQHQQGRYSFKDVAKGAITDRTDFEEHERRKH